MNKKHLEFELENAQKRVVELEARLQAYPQAEQGGENPGPCFDSLFESMSQGVVYQDAQGAIILANPAAQAILGLSLEQMQGRTSVDPRWRSVHEDGSEFPGDQHPAMLALRNGTPVENVTMGIFHPASGEYRWILVNAAPEFRAGENKPYQVYATFSDITRQVQVENELKESQKHFATIFRMNPAALMITEAASGRILDFNEAQLRLLEASREALAGKTTLELGIWADPDDRLRVMQLMNEQGDVHDLEIRIRTLAGKLKTILIAMEPFEVKGKPYVISSSIDITGRKQAEESLRLSEERFRLAFDNLLEGIQIIDFDWRYLYLNQAAERHNHRPNADLLGRVQMEAWSGFENSPLYSRLKACLEERLPHQDMFQFRFPDGQTGWFRIAIQPIPAGALILSEDVTEKQQIEEELRLRERMLNLFIENAPAAIAMFDRQMRYLAVSRRYLEDYRLGEQAVIGRSHYEIFPEISESIKNVHQRCLAGAVIKGEEQPFPRADGSLDWVRWEVHPWYEAPGQIGGLMLFSEVVTERKQAQLALEASEARFRALFETSGVIMLVLDPDSGEIVNANPAAAQFYGYAPETLAHANIQQINQISLEQLRQAIEQARNAKRNSFELPQRLASGRIRMVEVHSHPAQIDGRTYLHCIIYDITERQEIENRLREEQEKIARIAATVPGVFFSLRREAGGSLRIPYASPAVHNVLGLDPAEIERDATLFFKRIPGEDQTHLRRILRDSAKNMGLWQAEFRYQHPSQGPLWIETKAIPLSEPGGSIIWHGFITDVTERKWAEQQLKQRAEDLALINTLNVAVNQGADLKKIVSIFSSEILRVFNCSAVLACLSDGSRSSVTIQELIMPASREVMFSQWSEHEIVGLRLYLPPDDNGWYRLAAQSGSPHILSGRQDLGELITHFMGPKPPGELNREEFTSQVQDLLEINSAALLPVISEGELLGLLGLGRQEIFTESDQKRLEVIAGQASVSLGRKKAEQELRVSEEKYRSLMESLDNMVTTVDYDGRLLYINEVAARQLGGKSQDLTGKTLAEFFSPQTAEMQMQAIHKVLDEDKGLVNESLIHIQGQPRWYRTMIEPIHAENGRVVAALVNSTDIHDLKTTQAQLLEFNQTLEERVKERSAEVQDLYENAPIGYHSLDSEGRFLMVNNTELKWLGYERQEMIGHPITGFITSDSLAIFQAYFPLFKQRGWLKDLELEFVRKDGSRMPVLISATAIYDQSGNYQMSRSSLFDNTERDRAEKALRASEARLNFLLAETPAIVFTARAEAGLPITFISKSVQQILGHSPEQFTANPMFWASQVHPDDLPAVSQITRNLFRDGSILWEYRMKSAGGKYHWVASGMSLVRDESGRKREVAGYMVNIDSRKEAQQALLESEVQNLLLFEESPDAISLRDRKGVFIRVNRAFEQLTGKTREELIGKTAYSVGLLDDEAHEILSKAFEQASLTQEKFTSAVYQFKRAADRQITVESRVFLVKIGSRDHFLVTTRDVTTQKQAEETLRLVNAELERALRLKDEFLANMSHELRTPLNAILGISESLEEQVAGPLNPKQEQYIRTVRESGEHLLNLINDILDLSKIEAGQLNLNILPTSVEALTIASLRMVKELAQKKGLKLSSRIEAGIATIQSDERRMKQVLVNLLSNAVKFTLPGGKVALEVRGDLAAGQVTFSISDTGIGILSEDIPRLFQAFVQLDSGLDREQSGTGLGLALVAQIVRLHGGRVEVESEPGVGSRFSAILPWNGNESPALTGQGAALQTPAAPAASRKKKNHRILLVEDNEAVFSLMRDYLESCGYEVQVAQDGLAGIATAKSRPPDLILMDIQMPGMNGFEATRRIRQEPAISKIPVIALTAMAMSGDRERCLEAGMNDYLSKPISLKQLLEVIQRTLGSEP